MTEEDSERHMQEGFREHIEQQIGAIVPKIFIANIEKTHNHTNDYEEIKSIFGLLHMMSYLHPQTYVSKSKIINDSNSEYCKSPVANGTVENALRIFEKQYFDVICLLYCGTYRPIMVTLRQVLEQAACVTNSITNKEDLTDKYEDRGKAMSHMEFKNFLYHSEKSYEKKQKDVSGRKKIRSGKYFFPKIEKYIKYIEYEGMKKTVALNHIYGKLSREAHANLWYEVDDRNDDVHEPDQVQAYISNPNRKEYHRSLKIIIDVYKIVIYLLLVAAYINVGHYDKKTAKEFFDDMKYEIQQYPKIKFNAIEKLLANPPNIQEHKLGVRTNCSECGKIIKDDFRCLSCGAFQTGKCGRCGCPTELGTRCHRCDESDNNIPFDEHVLERDEHESKSWCR